ncbi:MAG TPA: DNA topoisomerase IB [Stellaceae bacterium]|nr:DNA topoisomerase IB [Stellaceae bacterium]
MRSEIETAARALLPAQATAAACEPAAAARLARLRYVRDDAPGITRRRAGTSFSYRDPSGRPIRDKETLARIKALAVPPAWREVWICPDPDGHIQAVGRDARGRKQYRYHRRWRQVRDEAKFGHMMRFVRALPRIRERVAGDLARPGLPRPKVLAAIVRLLETTLARIGNEEYARNNHSYGLTTLRNRHVRVRGRGIELDFRGKHGMKRHLELRDWRLARIIAKLQDLPGQELFQFVDDDGERHAIGSEDVNDYLREISGEEVTAKDFRTWAATTLAAVALREFEAVDSAAKAKANVLRAIEAVAQMLGNTPAVCRKCYIHPAILDGYLDGSLLATLKARAADAHLRDNLPGMTPEEAAVTVFLRERLEAEAEKRS